MRIQLSSPLIPTSTTGISQPWQSCYRLPVIYILTPWHLWLLMQNRTYQVEETRWKLSIIDTQCLNKLNKKKERKLPNKSLLLNQAVRETNTFQTRHVITAGFLPRATLRVVTLAWSSRVFSFLRRVWQSTFSCSFDDFSDYLSVLYA